MAINNPKNTMRTAATITAAATAMLVPVLPRDGEGARGATVAALGTPGGTPPKISS